MCNYVLLCNMILSVKYMYVIWTLRSFDMRSLCDPCEALLCAFDIWILWIGITPIHVWTQWCILHLVQVKDNMWCFVWSEYWPQPSEESSRGPTCCTGKILYESPLESMHYSICSERTKPWTYVLYRKDPVCATSRIHALLDMLWKNQAVDLCAVQGRACMCHL